MVGPPSQAPPGGALPSVPESTASPDWRRVPFEVPCGRCGQPLNGLDVAQCPGCRLTFAWQDVLPIEKLRCRDCGYRLFGLSAQRCPECGRSFTWSDALQWARKRPSAKPFEDAWAERPLHALGGTWLRAALHPRRLWSQYDLNAPVSLGPLLFFSALQWLVFARGWQTIAWFADPMMNTASRLLGRNLLFTYFLRTDSTFLQFMAVWYIATFACLQMFFVSNRRYRARWQLLLRIYVHATAFAALAPALWCVLEVMLDSSLFLIPSLRTVLNVGGLQSPYVLLGRGVFLLTALVTWCHLWIGYHCFLRYPRGWGVAALCLMLGYLIAELAIILYYWV